jgi:hypothetical protein
MLQLIVSNELGLHHQYSRRGDTLVFELRSITCYFWWPDGQTSISNRRDYKTTGTETVKQSKTRLVSRGPAPTRQRKTRSASADLCLTFSALQYKRLLRGRRRRQRFSGRAKAKLTPARSCAIPVN